MAHRVPEPLSRAEPPRGPAHDRHVVEPPDHLTLRPAEDARRARERQGEVHVVRAVVQACQRGVELEEDEDGRRVDASPPRPLVSRIRARHPRQEQPQGRNEHLRGVHGEPRAHHPDHVLDGVLVSRVEVPPRGEVLPVVVLVHQGVERGKVQDVVQRRVQQVHRDEHDPQREQRVARVQPVGPPGQQLLVPPGPQVARQPHDEGVLVERVDGQVRHGLAVQGDVPDGGRARLPCREDAAAEAPLDDLHHDVVVEEHAEPDREEAGDPRPRAREAPRVEVRRVVVQVVRDERRRGRIDDEGRDPLSLPLGHRRRTASRHCWPRRNRRLFFGWWAAHGVSRQCDSPRRSGIRTRPGPSSSVQSQVAIWLAESLLSGFPSHSSMAVAWY